MVQVKELELMLVGVVVNLHLHLLVKGNDYE